MLHRASAIAASRLVHDPRSAAYAERSERKAGFFDRTLYKMLEAASARLQVRERGLGRFVAMVDAHAGAAEALDDVGIAARAGALRGELLRSGLADAPLAETFALVRAASARHLGQRHFAVQIMGGYALARGMLAEMATGEGKTLTASLAAVAAALAGLPVHVVTVNDYLAERDAEHLRPVFAAFGLTTGFCKHGQSPEERRGAYACDITYTSNKEVAFDYLRDRIALGRRRTRSDVAVDRLMPERSGPSLLLRGLGFAIVDEADSVLVDEARTPLIIAGEGEAADGPQFSSALAMAGALQSGRDYTLLSRQRQVVLTRAGRAAVEASALARSGVFLVRAAREELVEQALAALHLFHRDEHYVVRDDKVQIVDEHTGRISDGRSWSRGLHQLIEAKEGVTLTAPNVTHASITYQRFFQRYRHLSGMSGTVAELAGELRTVYDLRVVRIPLNRPSRRISCGTRIVRDAAAKWALVADAVAAGQACGRAVLVGTRAVEASEALSAVLAARGIAHVVLNARQDAHEAAIIAAAGEAGRVTVATNIAGRGTDIRLSRQVRERGGLHIIATEFHESPRIDRQLIGRGGRQGDPASFEVIAAFDDDLLRRHCGLLARLLAGRSARAALAGWRANRLAMLAQARAARLHDAERARTLKSDAKLGKALSFAGAED